MKKHFYSAIFLSAILVSQAFSQAGQQQNSAEIFHALQKLNTVGSVLYVAAHPDDENTRLLAYLAKERKLRTGYLSLTRGDGGQNLIGKEQGELLGLIRTQELLAARRTDGAEQFFTRANDFGFSKNPDETFRIWNKDSILADVVWTIRRFRPDVIICRFPTTGEGGHGHHTASAILALEAFDAAADPQRFPQQLAYASPWQAKRIFWNTFNFGTTNTTAPDQIKIDVGTFNPLLGKGYGEIAAESRSMHKSQGFGSARARGSQLEYFKQLKGDSVRSDIFEGIDQSWGRLAGTQEIQGMIGEAIRSFDMQDPGKSVPQLAALYRKIENIKTDEPGLRYWREQKLKEAKNLLVQAAGLWLEAGAENYTGIPGRRIGITVQAMRGNSAPVKLQKVTFAGLGDTTVARELGANELLTFKTDRQIASNTPFSNPYWLNAKHDAGAYSIPSQALIGKPENDPAYPVLFSVEIGGVPLEIERGLVYKFTDPVKGEIYRPFEILPPATVNLSERVFVFSEGSPKKITFTVKANADSTKGTLRLNVPQGWIVSPSSMDFSLGTKGEEKIFEASLTPTPVNRAGAITAELVIDGQRYTKSISRVEYDHIPYQFVLSDAEARLVLVALKKGGTNIGYIPGAGDEIPASLKQIGYTVTTLGDEMLSSGDLSKFDAIVTGVRAYNTNDRLQVHYPVLMNYVRNGGNLIVQYNTNNRIGPVVAKISPFPFTISRERVTDEQAEVRFLRPEHPALNYPNKIGSMDFENWVQERGIYFANDIDKSYETILSMNDPGEKPNEGSLVIAKYGKGNFVYTGLVFFRELPAGVPGAYRLFANLLSLPKNK